jgi:hypothetical protein
LTLSDHQKTTPRQKALAKLATQGNHKFATGRRFKFRLPPLFSSRLSRHNFWPIALAPGCSRRTCARKRGFA